MLAARLDGFDRAQMRALADSLRNKWKTAVIVLAGVEDSNVAIITAVTKDLTAKVHAGKLAGAVAQAVGGKGGGRPDMAEGRRQGSGGTRRRSKPSTRRRSAAVDRSWNVSRDQLSTLVDVVGAGPTGLACGIELKRRGVNAVLFDKGCLLNSIYHYPTQHDVLHHAGTARNRRHPMTPSARSPRAPRR